MAHADMAEGVEHAFVGGDPVGERELGAGLRLSVLATDVSSYGS